MSIEFVMPSSHLILGRPLLLLPPIPPSISVFSNESTLCMRWTKYWRFSFSIIPSKEHPGLISFRMDWFDLLAVQGTLKCLLQHHSSKASILWHSAFIDRIHLVVILRPDPGNEQCGLVQLSSVAQSCLTLCDPMNRSTPILPVHHHLPEFTQTHVHRVRDAI